MYNIEKAATANNSITWLKIFKVNKTKAKHGITSNSQ